MKTLGSVFCYALCLAVFLLVAERPALAAATGPVSIPIVDQRMAAGVQAFQQGDFEQAALHWRAASDLYAAEGRLANQIDALLQLAEAYQALGQHRQSLEVLYRAQELVEKTKDRIDRARVLGGLGKAYYLLGFVDQARAILARETEDSRVLAVSLNNLGNLLSIQEKFKEAHAAYEESSRFARRIGDKVLGVQALTNAAKAALQAKAYYEAEPLLATALEQAHGLDNSYHKAYALIALGQAFGDLYSQAPEPKAQWLSRAYEALSTAGEMANALGNLRARAYAWGYLGETWS